MYARARHLQNEVPPEHDPFRKLQALVMTGDPLRRLTGPERAVGLRILMGFSAEAISAGLLISLQSTLTYRKRAYGKLGVSSQNKLFGNVLRLRASPLRLN
jgi:DNA-binding CsgD family transcriptional regulator